MVIQNAQSTMSSLYSLMCFPYMTYVRYGKEIELLLSEVQRSFFQSSQQDSYGNYLKNL